MPIRPETARPESAALPVCPAGAGAAGSRAGMVPIFPKNARPGSPAFAAGLI